MKGRAGAITVGEAEAKVPPPLTIGGNLARLHPPLRLRQELTQVLSLLWRQQQQMLAFL